MRRSLSVAVVAGLLAGAGVALAAPGPLQLRDRLLEQGEFAGYRVESTTQSYKTATAWVGAGPHVPTTQRSADIARLHREGFVSLLSEFLDRGSERQSGLSWVMQLGSAAAARAELKVDLAQNKSETTMGGGLYSAFSVPGFPAPGATASPAAAPSARTSSSRTVPSCTWSARVSRARKRARPHAPA